MNNQNQEDDKQEKPSNTDTFSRALFDNFIGELLITLIPTLFIACFLVGWGIFFLILPFGIIFWVLLKQCKNI